MKIWPQSNNNNNLQQFINKKWFSILLVIQPDLAKEYIFTQAAIKERNRKLHSSHTHRPITIGKS